MSVFVDTSAFYAILDADDDRHAAAAETWGRLLEAGRIHTTSYVIVETAALLQGRIGMDWLRLFAADILPVVHLVWVGEGVHRSALHALLVSGQRRLSLVDCVSFEVMRGIGIETAFCFDPHFAEQGFHLSPRDSCAGISRRICPEIVRLGEPRPPRGALSGRWRVRRRIDGPADFVRMVVIARCRGKG